MRKIEREMIDALKERRYFKKSNTEVIGNMVYLFDNLIFVIEEGKVNFSSNGWYSATTKSRLNAIMHWLGIGKIRQEEGLWYYTNGTISIPFCRIEGKFIYLDLFMSAPDKSNMDRVMKLNGVKEGDILFMGVTSTYKTKEEV